MNTYRKTLLAAVLPLGLALTTTTAIADARSHHGSTMMGHAPGHMERMAQRLELSESQRSQAEAIKAAHAPELKALRMELRERRRALHQGSRDGFNEAAVRADAEALGRVTTELTVVRARMRSQLYTLLTPEQQSRLEMRQRKAFDHDGHSHRQKRHNGSEVRGR